LRQAGGDPLGGVRRLQRGFHQRPNPGFPERGGYHRGRGFRAGKTIQLKNIVDEALKECPTIKNVIVYQRGRGKVNMQAGRDFWWHEEIKKASPEHKAEPMKAEDKFFILYTSGSTGKPRASSHHGGLPASTWP